MRCAVLGDPIAHSLSPVMHRAAYAELGLAWTYDAVRVASGGVREFLAGLDVGRDRQWRGLSLTMPLKREVVPLLSDHDAWVQLTGAANTVVLDEGGLHGSNTDVSGAQLCLERVGATTHRAVVLGGGATATSVLVALAERGLQHATIVVRDPARAEETITAVARHRTPPDLEVRSFDRLADVVAGVDLVVSTVPAAAQTSEVVEMLGAVPVVFEVVYDPWPTPIAAAAERRGAALITGLDLLVAQSVGQVTAMTGAPDVPVAAMRAAAMRELTRRAERVQR